MSSSNVLFHGDFIDLTDDVREYIHKPAEPQNSRLPIISFSHASCMDRAITMRGPENKRSMVLLLKPSEAANIVQAASIIENACKRFGTRTLVSSSNSRVVTHGRGSHTFLSAMVQSKRPMPQPPVDPLAITSYDFVRLTDLSDTDSEIEVVTSGDQFRPAQIKQARNCSDIWKLLNIRRYSDKKPHTCNTSDRCGFRVVQSKSKDPLFLGFAQRPVVKLACRNELYKIIKSDLEVIEEKKSCLQRILKQERLNKRNQIKAGVKVVAPSQTPLTRKFEDHSSSQGRKKRGHPAKKTKQNIPAKESLLDHSSSQERKKRGRPAKRTKQNIPAKESLFEHNTSPSTPENKTGKYKGDSKGNKKSVRKNIGVKFSTFEDNDLVVVKKVDILCDGHVVSTSSQNVLN